MALHRGFDNIQVLEWIDSDHFVGTIEYNYNYRTRDGRAKERRACYGWSKGGSFFIYEIGNGHIEKLGTVKRHEVLDDEPELV